MIEASTSTSYSIIELIKHADIIVKSVMLILVLASVWSWTLVFDKIFKFLVLKVKLQNFEKLFLSANNLEEIIKISRRKSNNPFAKILDSAVEEMQLSDLGSIIHNKDLDKKNSLKERMQNATQTTIDECTSNLESGLNFLAITGSVAPFIGLFGTVWGIMNSFQNIAVSKNTSLAVVAPGIAEALLATAIGLLAAIPAVFFYNICNNKLNGFIDKMNGFSTKVINSLMRNLEKEIK